MGPILKPLSKLSLLAVMLLLSLELHLQFGPLMLPVLMYFLRYPACAGLLTVILQAVLSQMDFYTLAVFMELC
jgi:hypothetical protein